MRIIVFTGKGGVGKTSVAAATALGIAKQGARTLVMSTDPAHSLADAFEHEIGPELTEIAPQLFGQQIDAQQRLEQHWREIQEFTTEFLSWAGADPVAAEEIMALPGIEEVFSLTDLRRHADEGSFDCIVVDCAPTAETLRLLSLPEMARWYIDRIFPVQRRVVKVVRPVLERVTSMPIANDKFYGAVERLYTSLDQVGKILDGRVDVVHPDRREPGEDGDRGSAPAVHLPRALRLPRRRRRRQPVASGHRRGPVLRQVEEDPVGAPRHDPASRSRPCRCSRPGSTTRRWSGPELLGELCREVYGEHDPAAILHDDEPMRVQKERDRMVLELRLPYADGRLDLSRKDDELIVTVGSYRRSIMLPQSLRRREVVDAGFEGPLLRIRFKGDDDA